MDLIVVGSERGKERREVVATLKLDESHAAQGMGEGLDEKTAESGIKTLSLDEKNAGQLVDSITQAAITTELPKDEGEKAVLANG